MVTVTVDDKYRVYIPKEAREVIHPGDVLFFAQEETEAGTVFRYAKAINPFDALAEDALRQHERGETVKLEDFLREQGIDPESLPVPASADAK